MSHNMSNELKVLFPLENEEEKLCEKSSRCFAVKSLKQGRDNSEKCSESEPNVEFIDLLDNELGLSADSDVEKETAPNKKIALETNNFNVVKHVGLRVNTNTSRELISDKSKNAGCVESKSCVIDAKQPSLIVKNMEHGQLQEKNNDGEPSFSRNIHIPPLTITSEPVFATSCAFEESSNSYFCETAKDLEVNLDVKHIAQGGVSEPFSSSASLNRNTLLNEEITNESPAHTSLAENGSANGLTERFVCDTSSTNSLNSIDLRKQADNYSLKPVQKSEFSDDLSGGSGANSTKTEMLPCFVKIERLALVNLRKQYPNLVVRDSFGIAKKNRILFRRQFPASHKNRLKQTLARYKKANTRKVVKLLSHSSTNSRSCFVTDDIANNTSRNDGIISCSRGCGSTFNNLSLLASHLVQCTCSKLPQISITRISSSAYSSTLSGAKRKSTRQYNCRVCRCPFANKVCPYGLCAACLAFAYQVGEYRKLRCIGQRNCSLLEEQRTSCRYCRYQAVIKTGFSATARRSKVELMAKARRLRIAAEDEFKPTLKLAKELTKSSMLTELDDVKPVEAHAKQSEITNKTCQMEVNPEESRTSLESSVGTQPEVVDVNNYKLCVVCGVSSNALCHGIRVCRACYIFYSRSYHKHKMFQCQSNGNCAINSANRTECKYCRFQKIVKAGATYKGFIRSEKAKEAAYRKSIQASIGESQNKQINMKGSSQARVKLEVMSNELLMELEAFGFVKLDSTNSIKFGICDQRGLIQSNQTKKSAYQFDALMSFVPDDCLPVFGFDTNRDFLCNSVGACPSDQTSDAVLLDSMDCYSLENGVLKSQVVPEKNLMYSPDIIYYPKPTPLQPLSDLEPLALTTAPARLGVECKVEALTTVYSPVSSEAITVSTKASVGPKVSTMTAASFPSSQPAKKRKKLRRIKSKLTLYNVANDERLSISCSSSSESDVFVSEHNTDCFPSLQYESSDEEVDDDKVLPVPVVTATVETIPLEEVRFNDRNIDSPTQTYHQRLSLGSSATNLTSEQVAKQHLPMQAISNHETRIYDIALDKCANDVQVEEKIVSLTVTRNSDTGCVRTLQQLDGANDGSSDDSSSKLSSSHSRSESEYSLTPLEKLHGNLSLVQEDSLCQTGLSGAQSLVSENLSAAVDVTAVQINGQENQKSYDADTDDEDLDWASKSTDYSSETSLSKPHALLVPQLAVSMVESAEFSLDDDILSQVLKENNGEVVKCVASKSSHCTKSTVRSTRKKVKREDVACSSEKPVYLKRKKKRYRNKEKGGNISLDKPKTYTPKKGTENYNSVSERNCQHEEPAVKKSARNTGDKLVSKKKKSNNNKKGKGETKTGGNKPNRKQKQTDVVNISHVKKVEKRRKKHTDNQIHTQTLSEVNRSNAKSGENSNLNFENSYVIKKSENLTTSSKDVKCVDGNFHNDPVTINCSPRKAKLSNDTTMLTINCLPRKAKLKAIRDKARIRKFEQNKAEESDNVESLPKVDKSMEIILKDVGDNVSLDKTILEDATPKPKPKKKESKQEKWNDLEEATALPDLSINVVLPSSSGDDSTASDEADSAGEDLVTTRKRTLRRKKPQVSSIERQKQREEMILTRRAVLARMATPRSAVLCELVQEEAQKQCAELLLPKNLPMYKPVIQPSRVMPFPEVHITEDDVSSLINSIFSDNCSVPQQDTQSLIADMKELKHQSVIPDNLLLLQLCLFISTSTSDPECLHNLLQVVAKYSMEAGSKCCPLPSCAGSGKVFDTSTQAGNHLLSHLPSVYTRFMGKAFKCTVCTEGFPTSLHHWDHWMACHLNIPYNEPLLQGFPGSCMEQLWLSPDYVAMMAEWNAAIVSGLRVPARDCTSHLYTDVSLESFAYKLPSASFTCCGESFIEGSDDQTHALYNECFFEDTLADEHVADTLECHELEFIPIPCPQVSNEIDESYDLFSTPELLALVTNKPASGDVSDLDTKSSVDVGQSTADVDVCIQAADDEMEDMTVLDQLVTHSCQQVLDNLLPVTGHRAVNKDEQAFICWYCGLPVLGRVAFYRHMLQESLGAGGVHSGCSFMDAEGRCNIDSPLTSNIDNTQPNSANTMELLTEHAYALPMLKCPHSSCRFHASDWSNLGDHVIDHLAEEMKELIPCWCGVCDESFASYYHAKHHWVTNPRCMAPDSKQIQIGQFLAHVTPGFHWTSNATCNHITFTKHKKFRFCTEYRSASHVICWVCFKLFKHETDDLGRKELNQSQELLQRILETHLREEHGIILSTGTKVYQAVKADDLEEEEKDSLTSSFLSKQSALNSNLKIVCDRLSPTSEALAACHNRKKTTHDQAKQVRIRAKKCDVHRGTFTKTASTCANCRLLQTSESFRYKMTNQEYNERRKLSSKKRRGFHCDGHNTYKGSCDDCRKMYWSNHKQPCIKHSSQGFALSCYQCQYTTKLVALRKTRKSASCKCHDEYVNSCVQCRIMYKRQLVTERKIISEEMASFNLQNSQSADHSAVLGPKNLMLSKYEDKSASSSNCVSTARKTRLNASPTPCNEHTAGGFMKTCVKCIISHIKVISLKRTGAVSASCLQDNESSSATLAVKGVSLGIKEHYSSVKHADTGSATCLQDTKLNSGIPAMKSLSQTLREKRPCCPNHQSHLATCRFCTHLYNIKKRQRPSCEKHSYHRMCCVGCISAYRKMMQQKYLAFKSTNPSCTSTARDTDKIKYNRGEVHHSESTRTASLSTAGQNSASTIITVPTVNKSRRKAKITCQQHAKYTRLCSDCRSLNNNEKKMKISKQRKQNDVLMSSATTLSSGEKLNISSTLPKSRVANSADTQMNSKRKKVTQETKSKEISPVFKRLVYGTVTSVKNAKVAMYDCSMTVQSFGKSIAVFSGEAVNVELAIESQIRAIGESGVKIIVACGPLDQLVVHYCNKYQVMIVAIKSRQDRTRIKRITGACLTKHLVVPLSYALGYVEEAIVRVQEGIEVVVFNQKTGDGMDGGLMSQQSDNLSLPAVGSADSFLPAPLQHIENKRHTVANVPLVGQSVVDESLCNSKELFSLMHTFNLPNDGELKDALNTVFSEDSDKSMMSASAFPAENTNPISAGWKSQVCYIPVTVVLSQQVSTPAFTQSTLAQGAVTQGALTQGALTQGALTQGALTQGVGSFPVASKELVHAVTSSNNDMHIKFPTYFIQNQSQSIIPDVRATVDTEALSDTQPAQAAKNQSETKETLHKTGRKTGRSKRSCSQFSDTPPTKKVKITSNDQVIPKSTDNRIKRKELHRDPCLKKNRVTCRKHKHFSYSCGNCQNAHKNAVLSDPDYKICTSLAAAKAHGKIADTSMITAIDNISAKQGAQEPSDAVHVYTKQKTSRKQKPAANSDQIIRKRGRPVRVDQSGVKSAKEFKQLSSHKITTRRRNLPRLVNISEENKQKIQSMNEVNKGGRQKKTRTLASAGNGIVQFGCQRRQLSTQADKKRQEQMLTNVKVLGHISPETTSKLDDKSCFRISRNENRVEIKQKIKNQSSGTEMVCGKKSNESLEDITPIKTKKKSDTLKVQYVEVESARKVKPSPRKTRSVTALKLGKSEHKTQRLDNNALPSYQRENRPDKFTSLTQNKKKHFKQKERASDDKKSKSRKHSGKINMTSDGKKLRSVKLSEDINLEIHNKAKRLAPKDSGSSSSRIKVNEKRSKPDVVKAIQRSKNLGAQVEDAKIKKVVDKKSNSDIIKPVDLVASAESTKIQSMRETNSNLMDSVHQATGLMTEVECSKVTKSTESNCNSGKMKPVQLSTGSVAEAAIINKQVQLNSGSVTKSLESKGISGGDGEMLTAMPVGGNGIVVGTSDDGNGGLMSAISGSGNGGMVSAISDGSSGEVVCAMSDGGSGGMVSAMSDDGNGGVVSAMSDDGNGGLVSAISGSGSGGLVSAMSDSGGSAGVAAGSYESLFQHRCKKIYRHSPLSSSVYQRTTPNSVIKEELGCNISTSDNEFYNDSLHHCPQQQVYLMDNYGQHDEKHCFVCPKRFKTSKHVWKHLRKAHLNLQVESSTTDPPLPEHKKQTTHMSAATELADSASEVAKRTEKHSSSSKKSATAATNSTDKLASSLQKHSTSLVKNSASLQENSAFSQDNSASSSIDFTDELPERRNKCLLSSGKKSASSLKDHMNKCPRKLSLKNKIGSTKLSRRTGKGSSSSPEDTVTTAAALKRRARVPPKHRNTASPKKDVVIMTTCDGTVVHLKPTRSGKYKLKE